MADLNALIICAKVDETKGFAAAARRLEMPVSTRSRPVRVFKELAAAKTPTLFPNLPT